MIYRMCESPEEASSELSRHAAAGRGLWIGLHPERRTVDLAVSGDLGPPQDDLHLTLVHLGRNQSSVSVDRAVRMIREISVTTAPVTPYFDGVARFSSRESDPVVALVRHPRLTVLASDTRERVGLLPAHTTLHVTLGRVPDASDLRLGKSVVDGSEWLRFTHVSATCGDARYLLPLQGPFGASR